MRKKEATQKRRARSQQNSRARGRGAAVKPKALAVTADQLNVEFTPLTDVVAKVDRRGMPYLTFKNLNAERAALRSNIGRKLTLEEFLEVSGES